jgi:hypothetical protein
MLTTQFPEFQLQDRCTPKGCCKPCACAIAAEIAAEFSTITGTGSRPKAGVKTEAADKATAALSSPGPKYAFMTLSLARPEGSRGRFDAAVDVDVDVDAATKEERRSQG